MLNDLSPVEASPDTPVQNPKPTEQVYRLYKIVIIQSVISGIRFLYSITSED
ncbi:MAG: hypothetical protein HDT23_08395 [Ruminococcus sp.]|nr:hypothetical protein [Ruminococcus sp.]